MTGMFIVMGESVQWREPNGSVTEVGDVCSDFYELLGIPEGAIVYISEGTERDHTVVITKEEKKKYDTYKNVGLWSESTVKLAHYTYTTYGSRSGSRSRVFSEVKVVTTETTITLGEDTDITDRWEESCFCDHWDLILGPNYLNVEYQELG